MTAQTSLSAHCTLYRSTDPKTQNGIRAKPQNIPTYMFQNPIAHLRTDRSFRLRKHSKSPCVAHIKYLPNKKIEYEYDDQSALSNRYFVEKNYSLIKHSSAMYTQNPISRLVQNYSHIQKLVDTKLWNSTWDNESIWSGCYDWASFVWASAQAIREPLDITELAKQALTWTSVMCGADRRYISHVNHSRCISSMLGRPFKCHIVQKTSQESE